MGWGEGGPLSRRLAIFSIFPERDIQKGDQGTTGLLQAQQVDLNGVCPKQWTLSARGLPARAWDQLCKLGLGERGAEEVGGLAASCGFRRFVSFLVLEPEEVIRRPTRGWTRLGAACLTAALGLETTAVSSREQEWLTEVGVSSGRQRWSCPRWLLETLTALSQTTLWVGASLGPRALFRRLKGQQLNEAACREALIFLPP